MISIRNMCLSLYVFEYCFSCIIVFGILTFVFCFIQINTLRSLDPYSESTDSNYALTIYSFPELIKFYEKEMEDLNLMKSKTRFAKINFERMAMKEQMCTKIVGTPYTLHSELNSFPIDLENYEICDKRKNYIYKKYQHSYEYFNAVIGKRKLFGKLKKKKKAFLFTCLLCKMGTEDVTKLYVGAPYLTKDTMRFIFHRNVKRGYVPIALIEKRRQFIDTRVDIMEQEFIKWRIDRTATARSNRLYFQPDDAICQSEAPKKVRICASVLNAIAAEELSHGWSKYRVYQDECKPHQVSFDNEQHPELHSLDVEDRMEYMMECTLTNGDLQILKTYYVSRLMDYQYIVQIYEKEGNKFKFYKQLPLRRLNGIKSFKSSMSSYKPVPL